MSFGLSNAPATFQRAMNEVLRGLLWSTVLCYLDDCIVMAKGFDDMLVNLREVFSRFRDNNLKMKPKKCDFFRKEVKFLGWIVNEQGVGVDPPKIKTIMEWPTPTTVKQLQAFIGLVNYHRNYIPKFAVIAAPLHRQTTKKHLEWSMEERDAFEALKLSLVSPPLVGFPDPDKTFVLDTDASDIAIGCELGQVELSELGEILDTEWTTIEYNSVSLSPSQRRYCATRKELLAIVYFCHEYRHYLSGKRFFVRTDHFALTWLCGFKNPQSQLARWIEQLQQYDMVIVYRRGKQHLNADALSRRPNDLQLCENYRADVQLEDLPCMQEGLVCNFCMRAHRDWARFNEDVDYVVPLTVRQTIYSMEPQVRSV